MFGARRATPAVAASLALGMGLAAGGCSADDPAPTSSTDSATSSTAPTTTSTSVTTEPTTEPTTGPTTASGCFEDMAAVSTPPEVRGLAFPDRTKIYDVEVRGDNGVLLTGVTDLLFRAAVYQMRERYSDPPFEIVDTDEGEGAVGVIWSGASTSGRWVLTDISAVCPGDTEVKLLWTSAGSLGD